MGIKQSKILKIGIIGAGFSGTTLAANIHRLSTSPVEIYLFEKTGNFGTGYAYSTPFFFHLLNVRASDMSAFEDEPLHFVDWMNSNAVINHYLDTTQPTNDQFLPRLCYGQYLKHLLQEICKDVSSCITLKLIASEIIDMVPQHDQIALIQKGGETVTVDKIVLALGNHEPPAFPFPTDDTFCIANPWDYCKPQEIAKEDPVLIVGTGLSMVDVVLTLHYQQHQGMIYAISRHGLMPLPHATSKVPFVLMKENLPNALNPLMKQIRKQTKHHAVAGGDWRSVMNALRTYMPNLWSQISLIEKKRFMRHLLPYWNIHRHRLHPGTIELIAKKTASHQFKMLSGRVLSTKNGVATIKVRKTDEIKELPVKWVINCMGPSLQTTAIQQPLICSLLKSGLTALDPLNLGVMTSTNGALQDTNGNISSMFYTLGSLRKGMIWESNAVPEIRKQSLALAKLLLDS